MKYRTLNDVSSQYREQAKIKYEAINNRDTRIITDRKSNAAMDEKLPLEILANKRFDSKVRVHFHSIRIGHADLDNISGKAALDAIVKSKILPDDGPRWIPERPVHTVEYGKEEKTIITIEEIDN